MARSPIAVAILFLCMIAQPAIGTIAAPNDSDMNGNSVSTLSIDGFVTTKFASVGSVVDIQAHTMGHTNNARVSADILQYDIDPIDSAINSFFPGQGQFIDRVVLQSNGPHDNDSSVMTWQGSYTIPVTSTGGVYGARIFVEDGNNYAVDDTTQLREVFRVEFEKVLSAIDTAWDTANPLGEIADEFEELETKGTSNGGWSNFVDDATKGGGAGGSKQLWNSMLNAGHNQYNMSAGANFLEALMDMLDSEDGDAGVQFIVGLMTYLDNMALPRTLYEFDEMTEYIRSINVIENFTRFEGTGDFEAAYNALTGSSEWDNMTQALDNLADGTKPFESAQVLMRNIALLAVSNHPEDIAAGLAAWAEPLFEGDVESMTPFQLFVLRFAEMAGELNWETDTQDYDGDEIPDTIRWQYEYLLETSEGQAWTARIQSDAPYVNEAFDDFNSLPEDIMEIVIDSTEHPIWEETGETLAVFGSWMNNASRADMYLEWPDYEDDDSGDEEGDDSEERDVIFNNLYPMQTTIYDSHLLEVGIALELDAYDTCEGKESSFSEDDVLSISMTNERGYQVSTNLVWDENENKYFGLLIAPELEATTWTLSQPLEEYTNCDIPWAVLEVDRSLRPSMLETSSVENNDEIFMVSAIGVLVDQPETSQVGQPYIVTSQTYDSAGIISNAEADIAILRISPQLGQSAVESLAPEGETDISINYPSTLQGTYNGQDLDGDLTIEMMRMGEYNGDNYDLGHPQSYYFDPVQISSNGNTWDASNYLPNERGLIDLVISGTTTQGIEFTEVTQIPLSGSLGCAGTRGNFNENNVEIGYEYRSFESSKDEVYYEYYKPMLDSVTVSWGDGTETEYTVGDGSGGDPSGWSSHDYQSSGEYYISVEFVDEYGTDHTEYVRYSTDDGFWIEDSESDEGGYWHSWKSGSDCWLDNELESTPSPQLIDSFITDGPFEVITEQVMDVDANGLASISFVPNHPGLYLTIVQSKGTLDNGDVKTGIGLNFGYVTNGEISISGLEQVTTFAGLPVYIANTDNNGLNTVTVTPEGIPHDNFNVTMGIAPIKLDVAFPDIDWDAMSDEQDYLIEFQSGDTSRNQEVRFESPMSLMGIAANNPDGELMAEAMHVGLVLNDPGQLNMMGTLGPGQTTNIALNSEDGETSRIFAVAVPKVGFDPASIDFASFTSLIYEGIREDVGWVAEDRKSSRICEYIEYNSNSGVGGISNSINVEITLRHDYDNRFKIMDDTFEADNVVLLDADGNEIVPNDGWDEEYQGSRSMRANFALDEGEYELHTGTSVNSEFELEIYDGDWRDDSNCEGDQELNQEDAFDLFDDFFSDVNSIAWGLGSSADLTLPHLASPTSNYTVVAMVQQGTGDSATISAAIGSQIAEPNPEPLVMKDLTMDYLPENPAAGDTMLITITEQDSGIPVEMLSVVVIENDFTVFSDITNSNGQTSFVLEEGTFLIRASGGMYNPAEFTIIVTSDGSEEQETEDTDGDNIPDIFDNDDDNDGVDDLNDLCPDTAEGVTVDNDGCPVEGDNSNDNTDEDDDDSDENPSDECAEWEYWNPELVDTTKPGNGCPYYEEEDRDATSDSSENKILGMDPITLGALAAVLVIAILAATMYVRRGSSQGDDDWYEQQDTMFDDPYKEVPSITVAPPVAAAPRSPPPSHQGYMQDGYEVTEYPQGSGNWWWKDAQTGRWTEWK